MKKIIYTAIAAACISMAFSCSSGKSQPKGEKTLLAVSIEPQRKILEELSGGNFEVFTVMPAGANPETYDPPMSARARMAQAKAYFTTGHLAFEEAVAGSTPTIDTSVGIIPVTGTHGHDAHEKAEEEQGHDEHNHDSEHHGHGEGEHHHHDHGEADPHMWTSVRNAKAMAYAMLAQLVAADTANADAYRANFAKMIARYDSLDAAISRRLQGARHSFAVWHPSLSYFARDYGLKQISVGQESKEMPAGRLKEIIDLARADSVEVFFFQKEYDSRQAESLNREIGSRLVNINPLSYDWEEELMRVADELSK
ncbi:MAG: zinc ABC transporter substrate-binding protein [Clostridium sp.]|nr:zinc ABC transporter substrate-binding protein [Clostridium sp.]